jgi:hypothetical protein
VTVLICVVFTPKTSVTKISLKYFKSPDFVSWFDSPPVGQGLLIIEGARSHSDTQNSVGLLWTSDQSPSQRPLRDSTQHSQQTNIHVAGGIRTCNPNTREAADPRLRPRGHWDRQKSDRTYDWNKVCSELSSLSARIASDSVVESRILGTGVQVGPLKVRPGFSQLPHRSAVTVRQIRPRECPSTNLSLFGNYSTVWRRTAQTASSTLKQTVNQWVNK